MAIFRSIILLNFLLCFTINLTNALYEDQVGKFDWKRSYVGKVKQAQIENNRIILTTEENILASINQKNGQISWRQILEQNHHQYLLHIDSDITSTISGTSNNYYIRSWDTPTGTLLWEWTITPEHLAHDDIWSIHGQTVTHIALFPGQSLEINHHNLKTGELRDKTAKIPASWVGTSHDCLIAHPYVTCASTNQLTWLNIHQNGAKPNSKPIQAGNAQLVEFRGQNPAVLLAANNQAQLIELTDNDAIFSTANLLPNAVSFDNHVFELEVNANNPAKLIRIKKRTAEGLAAETTDVEYPVGLGAPQIVAAACKDHNCDLLLSSTDNALTLVRVPEGRALWTREEALSNVVASEFFELPVSELDVSLENEFKSSDILTMLQHRLATQSKQLYAMAFGGPLLANNGLVRDEFGLHKIIILATKAGKLFGIDTLTGAIVWSHRLPHVRAFNGDSMLLLAQRTARYAPLPAQCVLVAQDAATGAGVLFQFDPITGVSSRGIERLGYAVKQALLLPNEDEHHVKPIVVIADDNSVKVYPEVAGLATSLVDGNIFVYLIDAKNTLCGYKLADGLEEVWRASLGGSEIVGFSTRPINEQVHSQGRVLPDRSVYYKYVNPNLVALATLTDDPVHKHVLSVYLIDGVTGLVLYSSSHKRAKGPVHLVHSENWLVYTFFNERFRRFEMVASELYEGHIQSNSTAFSSFSVGQLPHVQSQAYILPATPVSMAVTLTERGITSKFVLVGLSTGAVTEIPWLLLQPRLEDVACGPEESCIPYMPEIPLPNEAIINYNLTLERIKGIKVAPARLESTSHVLVYGLDLFYTRMAPSKTFDVLKEDFDHRLIILVLFGLIAASYVSKYLAARKTLRQAWK